MGCELWAMSEDAYCPKFMARISRQKNMIFKLAWRNLWRNKSRTAITIASVFFAVVLSVVITSIQRGAMQNLVKGVVGFYSSYVQVHKKGYFDDQTLDNVLEVNDTLLARIKSQSNVTYVSPRLETF